MERIEIYRKKEDVIEETDQTKEKDRDFIEKK